MREAIDPGPHHGEQCRQERQRGDGRPGHDDDPGYPHRAQEHELEKRQAHQPDQDRGPGEEDRFARRGDRPLHRQRHVAAISGQLLAVARGDEQRVVDRKTETEHGRQVEHENREVGHPRRDKDRDEHQRDSCRPNGQRHQRGDHGAEDQQQRDQRDGKDDHFRPAQVALARRLDVAVGRPGAGDRYPHLVLWHERGLELRDQALRLLRTRGEPGDGVRGIAVVRDQTRVGRGQNDPGDAWQRPHPGQRPLDRRLQTPGRRLANCPTDRRRAASTARTRARAPAPHEPAPPRCSATRNPRPSATRPRAAERQRQQERRAPDDQDHPPPAVRHPAEKRKHVLVTEPHQRASRHACHSAQITTVKVSF